MREYLKTRWQSWAMAAAMLLMAVIVLFLYDVPLEPVGYIAVLVIICETGFLIWGYCKYRKKQQNPRKTTVTSPLQKSFRFIFCNLM